ncbi:hypothetical protein LOZ34_005445 [Ophidiomyces ophidiicola]|nr:hypothetical protein LOZ34_005445 [Ophidiomyces ophidiicola]
MPPRALTGSFAVADAANEVVCPLTNNDGSNCRKRCLGEKRYRSMQEHIRRAHPSHYIPKLPATEESFQLMVSTPPDQRPRAPPPPPQQQQQQQQQHPQHPPQLQSQHPQPPRHRPPPLPQQDFLPAAVALAQLQQHHHHRAQPDWDSEPDSDADRLRSSVELPPLRDHFKQDAIPAFSPRPPRELLPSILAHSPPGRSSTLPPIQRRDKLARPRKGSLSAARRGKHERTRSKELARRNSLSDRKALSAEPQTAAWVQGKRWEDLIEAATSATEVDDDRDHTPKALTPPPYEHGGPPDTDLEPFPSVESSLDSNSSISGKNFHFSAAGLPPLADSSPVQPPRPGTSAYPPSSHPHQLQPHIRNRIHHRLSNPTPLSSHSGKDVHVYCAGCARPWPLRDCLACTECICAACRECVSLLPGATGASPPSILNPTSNPGNNGLSGHNGITGTRLHLPARRGCPSCGVIGRKWKHFQLDFR